MSKPTTKPAPAKAAPVFLQKTYALFDEAPATIASWAHEGRTVVVKDPQEFARSILPQYFKHSNFASFVRQLNFYGFRKYKRDEMLFGDTCAAVAETGMQYWWEFYHPKFVRAAPQLMSSIRRKTYSEAPPASAPSESDDMGALKEQVSTLQTQYHQLSSQLSNLEMLVKTLIMTHKRAPPTEAIESIKKPKPEETHGVESLCETSDDAQTPESSLGLSLPGSPLHLFDVPIDDHFLWPDELPPAANDPNVLSGIDEIIFGEPEPKLPSPPRCSMQADRPLMFRFTLPALK
ncbi:hypothetical protein SPRG_19171 [Saprolegnia parasitica CBS 223.65]|uniref:HSF-type DNA-binding domain-containing protein n=1 Tax=Saprolegnia parasitica (strain CBS 223.65) TaxID=695850 RepID=A0A067CSN1_SAPPC|nr:hypothetical protein SPRG_19171 [Saprolegnia parasitica CBS 223.65]KDO33538.1 hypothetical protein SPRG_19171 [Saprolegnia parasitica CBS 223.65]|eukprot:XP_012195598.1 hypothetical protein SPRG_19171 [Saprolegnia parasitica CBS 223.65]